MTHKGIVERYLNRGSALLEVVIVTMLMMIVALMAFPYAKNYWDELIVEREASQLAYDLRRLQAQSRSNGYRTPELRHFYAESANLYMRFTADGYKIQRTVYKTIYRHDFPQGIRLTTAGNMPISSATISFGVQGGSTQNNTFRIYSIDDTTIYRYVIISAEGRIRVDKKLPTSYSP